MKASKESEINTTSSVQEDFLKVSELLISIGKKIPDAAKEFEPVAYWLRTMQDTDVLLEYRVIAHTKNGQIFNVEGVNNIPRVFDEAMLPEAPSNFENSFNACLVRPALNAFMKHMRIKIDELKKTAMLATQPQIEPFAHNNSGNTEFLAD